MKLAQALRDLDDLPSRLAVTAERTLLTALEAGCSAPIGALGSLHTGGGRHDEPSHLRLDAVVCRPDGTAQLRTSASVPLLHAADHVAAARRLGEEVARQMLAGGAADLADLPRATLPGGAVS